MIAFEILITMIVGVMAVSALIVMWMTVIFFVAPWIDKIWDIYWRSYKNWVNKKWPT